MNILVLLNRVPWPLNDGGSIAIYNFLKGYRNAGCQLTIAAFNTTKHHVQELPEALTKLGEWHTVPLDNQVKWIPALGHLIKGDSYLLSRFRSAVFEQEISRLLQQQQFDTVIVESLFMAHYLPVIRKYTPATVILRQHNIEHHIWETLASRESNILKRLYFKQIAGQLEVYEKSIINLFDGITVFTENDKKDHLEMGLNKPIQVAPVGIDIHLTEPRPASTKPTIFHIGSMEWMPNITAIQWFIDFVWPRVREQHPSAELHLAGRGMNPKQDWGTNTGIHNHGEVENAFRFILSHRIMIVPLFAGSGIRVKILEAMAAGKAIISTSLGAQGIDIIPGTHLLIANTADEFCQCINLLLNNPEYCDELGQAASKLVAGKYDNTKVVAEVLTFYRTLQR